MCPCIALTAFETKDGQSQTMHQIQQILSTMLSKNYVHAVQRLELTACVQQISLFIKLSMSEAFSNSAICQSASSPEDLPQFIY
jgi:hypothetical protein